MQLQWSSRMAATATLKRVLARARINETTTEQASLFVVARAVVALSHSVNQRSCLQRLAAALERLGHST
jgi:hypothetical protein